MKHSFYHLSKNEKAEVLKQVAEKRNVKTFAVEKDWWVTQTLALIYQLDFSAQLLFKGGTSLSKAWGLINRFSEDIDLAINREYLSFSSGLISKTQVKKLRSASFEFVSTTFYMELQQAFKNSGFTDVSFDYENLGDGDQDPVSVLIYYPSVTQHSTYILPRVKVEVGCRSLKEPFTNCGVVSFIGEQFSTLPFADQPFTIPCVNPERTFLEKLFLLHEEFQKPQGKIRVERLSRHLYDIARIYESPHKSKAYDKDLIINIIKHRERFNQIRGLDYKTLFPPSLNSLPPKELIKAWKDDYVTMQTNMIPEESPSFESLLKTVALAVEEYNALEL